MTFQLFGCKHCCEILWNNMKLTAGVCKVNEISMDLEHGYNIQDLSNAFKMFDGRHVEGISIVDASEHI